MTYDQRIESAAREIGDNVSRNATALLGKAQSEECKADDRAALAVILRKHFPCDEALERLLRAADSALDVFSRSLDGEQYRFPGYSIMSEVHQELTAALAAMENTDGNH